MFSSPCVALPSELPPAKEQPRITAAGLQWESKLLTFKSKLQEVFITSTSCFLAGVSCSKGQELCYTAQVLLILLLMGCSSIQESEGVQNGSVRSGTVLSAFKVENSMRQGGILEFPTLSPLA